MKGPKMLFIRDTQIDKLLEGISKVVKKKRMEKDRRGQWFANNQLDNLRQLLERKGYKTARLFQVGKIERGSNRWEFVRNEALLEILDEVASSDIDVMTCSYILGKLNSLIDELEKKGGRNV
jgi:hypothetical protein